MNNPLTEHKDLFKAELGLVDESIISISDGRPFLIKELLEHIINSGGKRLRPIYLILSAKLFDEETNDNVVKMASCVELLHTATLFHDDVVDGSKMRRGKETANEMWGNSASVLVGDFLLAQAFGIMSSTGMFEIIEILSKASSVITEGEINQLIHKTDIKTSYDDYISIITAKTAGLFSACCKVGAVVQNADEKQKQDLAEFGLNLGIAFQIADDTIDYTSAVEDMGKVTGDDFREGKVTLPLIYTYQDATHEEKQYLESLFDADEYARCEDAFNSVLEMIKKYDAYERSLQEARKYAEKATQNLSSFEGSEVKKAMLDLLDFSVNRRF